MFDAFTFDVPLVEILARGSAVYLTIAVAMRLLPKRHLGHVSPNDIIALVIVGALAADGILGDIDGLLEILLMIAVVLLWDHLFNVLEHRFPRFRRIAQDSPTLLVRDGRLLKQNLHREMLTEDELQANLRKQGIEHLSQVQLAILEVDGQISVIEKRE